MPKTKSVKKALRKSLKRRRTNLRKKQEIKKLQKALQVLISEQKFQEARKLLPKLYRLLDKAAKTGMIKKQRAARKKSRITKQFTKAQKIK